MQKKHKDVEKPKRREIVFNLDCPCGRSHQLRIARGEGQLINRSLETGKLLPQAFKPRHIVLEHTREPPK